MQCTSIVFLPKHPESSLEKSIIQIPIERYSIKHLTGNTQHCQGQQKNSLIRQKLPWGLLLKTRQKLAFPEIFPT